MHTRTACPVWPVPVACRIHFEIVELRDREHACEAQRGQGMAWMDSWGGVRRPPRFSETTLSSWCLHSLGGVRSACQVASRHRSW